MFVFQRKIKYSRFSKSVTCQFILKAQHELSCVQSGNITRPKRQNLTFSLLEMLKLLSLNITTFYSVGVLCYQHLVYKCLRVCVTFLLPLQS
jgi:hypothetical protein